MIQAMKIDHSILAKRSAVIPAEKTEAEQVLEMICFFFPLPRWSTLLRCSTLLRILVRLSIFRLRLGVHRLSQGGYR